MIRRLGGLHRFFGLGPADPHGLGRISGDVSRREAGSSPRRAFSSGATSTGPALPLAGTGGGSSARRLRGRRRDGPRRVHPVSRDRGGRARVHGAHAPLGAALPRTASRARGDRGALFGIVQGGVFARLREESAAAIASLPFDGVACGGLRWASPRREMRATVALMAPLLPAEKPRYLMGVGRPDDLLDAVARGFDLFDCVLPTRAARHGFLYTAQGTLAIKHARYREDRAPPDPACSCPTCRRHSRAYLQTPLRRGRAYGRDAPDRPQPDGDP